MLFTLPLIAASFSHFKKDKEAKAILENTQQEEVKRFGMNLEFLLRRKPEWRTILKLVLFTTGDIVERAKKGEEKVEK